LVKIVRVRRLTTE